MKPSKSIRYFEGRLTSLPNNAVFVFGSNQAGRHGAGAALDALHRFGARRGVGEGRSNQSYAIPTKDHTLKVRSLNEIAISIQSFLFYASLEPQTDFYITELGCGLAGYSVSQIAPLFRNATENCIFPRSFQPYLES